VQQVAVGGAHLQHPEPSVDATAHRAAPPAPDGVTRDPVDDMSPTAHPRLSPLPLQITINGRLEHLRGAALGFRNLTNYIVRSLLDTGGFRPRLHPLLREPSYCERYWGA